MGSRHGSSLVLVFIHGMSLKQSLLLCSHEALSGVSVFQRAGNQGWRAPARHKHEDKDNSGTLSSNLGKASCGDQTGCLQGHLTLPPHRINTSGGEQPRSDSLGLQLRDGKGAARGRKEASSPYGKRAAPGSPLLQRRPGVSEGTANVVLKT